MYQGRVQTERIMQVKPELIEWMRTIRRTIHSHPELAFKEVKTSNLVKKELDSLGIPFVDGVAGTGVVARLGEESGNGHVMLRADMDALPVTEETGHEFASLHHGVMHACGHDGHTAMLLGAAKMLVEADFNGRIDLLFQPAEEAGGGAARVVDSGLLEGVEAIFGGHIDTHFPTGVITVDEGIICAWADPFTIHIRGRGGHAARPQEAVDAVVASASLINGLQTLVSRETNPNHSAVVTVGKVRAGVSHNVIAAEALLEGTVRSTDPVSRARTLAGIERVVGGIGALHGVTTELVFNESLPAVENSPVAAAIARQAATMTTDSNLVISQGPPSLGGEDFSFYQQQTEGCLVRFGAEVGDDTGPAHSSTFDFDEDVLPIGAAWLATSALTWLSRG